jgi:DNA-binding transcriptional regulator YdaS (Cro superfamily)
MTLLADWLQENKHTYSTFARAIGTHRSQIARCAKGERGPGVALAAAIEKATDGAVPMESWTKRAKRSRRRAA